MTRARAPIYKVTCGATTIDFGKRLITLTISDESGIKSDSCDITLDNQKDLINVPKTGTNLSVSLGYKESGVSHMGNYTVNEITMSGPPNVINIKCHAADLSSSLKEKISGSFDGTTIGSLVESVASKYGLTPRVSNDFAGIVLDHLDQTNESDMHFLTRLASKYGAIAKPANGNLLFAAKGLAKSISGLVLGETTLDIKDVISWSYTESTRENYKKVKSEYVDFENGEIEESESGEDDGEGGRADEKENDEDTEYGSTYGIAEVSANKNAAQTIANTAFREINRNSRKIQITTLGNTNLVAESRVLLTGFQFGIPINWIISKAEHSLNNQGFLTQIECSQS